MANVRSLEKTLKVAYLLEQEFFNRSQRKKVHITIRRKSQRNIFTIMFRRAVHDRYVKKVK